MKGDLGMVMEAGMLKQKQNNEALKSSQWILKERQREC